MSQSVLMPKCLVAEVSGNPREQAEVHNVYERFWG